MNTSANNNFHPAVKIGVSGAYAYELEQCEMLMTLLGWSYKFINGDDPGLVNATDPFASTGLTGDLINGRLDLLCSHHLMSSLRISAHEFSYPTRSIGRDVYIFQDTKGVIRKAASIGQPFTWKLWLMVLVSVMVAITVFALMQAIIERRFSLRQIGNGLVWLSNLSINTGNDHSSNQLKSFKSINLVSVLWLLLWGPVILQLYQANLKSFLTVSEGLRLPFTDFDTLLDQMRRDTYHLLLYEENLPRCPISYGREIDCQIFLRLVLDAHSSLNYYRDDEAQIDFSGKAVLVLAYSSMYIPDKVSLFVDDMPYKANLLAVRNDQIINPPTAFPLRHGFEHRRSLDEAIVSLQLALNTRDSILTQRISALRFHDTVEAPHRTKSIRFDVAAEQTIAHYATVQKAASGEMIQAYLKRTIHEIRKIIRSAEQPANGDPEDIVHRLQKKISQQMNPDSELSKVIESQVERIMATVLNPENIPEMLKGLKQEVCERRIHALEIDAYSAADYLFDLKTKGFIRHCDIVFRDGRREVYFTQKQLTAIDIFNKGGSLKNQRQIITGAPGSGKSLILMMKLFLLKQIRSHKKLAFASWYKHDYVVKGFLQRNACKCCRRVEFFSEHGLMKRLLDQDRPVVKFAELETGIVIEDGRFNETKHLAAVLADAEYDVVLDERHIRNNLRRFKKSEHIFDDVISIAAVTGGYQLKAALTYEDKRNGTYPAWMDQEDLIEPIHLSTVFRSTNQIMNYVLPLLNNPLAISGHSFDGVPVEKYTCEMEETAFKEAATRITRLNELMGKFSGSQQIAVIAEDPKSFTAYLAYPYGSCLPHTGRPQCASDVPSLEFPIVIVICSGKSAPFFLPIAASRAVCHLIVFQYEKSRCRNS